MSFKYRGRGSLVDIARMGRVEVKPGSEDRVAEILAQYQSQCSVKITYAPNYVGNSKHHVDGPTANKRPCR